MGMFASSGHDHAERFGHLVAAPHERVVRTVDDPQHARRQLLSCAKICFAFMWPLLAAALYWQRRHFHEIAVERTRHLGFRNEELALRRLQRSRSRLRARSARPRGVATGMPARMERVRPTAGPSRGDWAVSSARAFWLSLALRQTHHHVRGEPTPSMSCPSGLFVERGGVALPPKLKSRVTCTEPLPNVVDPTSVARWLSLSDAASTSAEAEVLPFTSKTSGFSVT